MLKHLHAVEFDNITFGMDIETDTIAYQNFKKSIKTENVISYCGDEFEAQVVPYLKLGAIMGACHWLVTEIKSFKKVCIEGLNHNDYIYVKYSDQPIDFSPKRSSIYAE